MGRRFLRFHKTLLSGRVRCTLVGMVFKNCMLHKSCTFLYLILRLVLSVNKLLAHKFLKRYYIVGINLKTYMAGYVTKTELSQMYVTVIPRVLDTFISFHFLDWKVKCILLLRTKVTFRVSCYCSTEYLQILLSTTQLQHFSVLAQCIPDRTYSLPS